jgi:hypothetical protein
MKIQNPGNAVGDCKTPLNVKERENIKVAILPAVAASGSPAISICAKLLA